MGTGSDTERAVSDPGLDASLLFAFLPALVSLPLLGAPIPQGSHPAREIAGHFQALAILRDGLASYYYFTPDESMTALHLHSLLSSPLLAAGWVEGGRLVSLVAMVASAVLVLKITVRLTDSEAAGLLAVGAFWVHPWILAVSTAYTPDALGIALTTLSVYAALEYSATARGSWFVVLCVATVLGAANHMWELSVWVPIAAILLWDRSYRELAGFTTVAVLSAGAVVAITSLQPGGTTSHTSYSIISSPLAVFDPSVWLGRLTSPHPVNVDVTFSVIGAVLGAVFAGLHGWRTRDRTWVVISAWLASAVAIPVALPLGYGAHLYYSWGVYAPLAVAGGALVCRSSWCPPAHWLSTGAIATAVVYLLVFEFAVVTGLVGSPALTQATTPVVVQQSGLSFDETRPAAAALSERDVAPARIAFEGDWARAAPSTDGEVRFGNALGASQVLVYSETLVKSRRLNTGSAPKLGRHPDCEVSVRRQRETVTVTDC